jgi:hypothetical protein
MSARALVPHWHDVWVPSPNQHNDESGRHRQRIVANAFSCERPGIVCASRAPNGASRIPRSDKRTAPGSDTKSREKAAARSCAKSCQRKRWRLEFKQMRRARRCCDRLMSGRTSASPCWSTCRHSRRRNLSPTTAAQEFRLMKGTLVAFTSASLEKGRQPLNGNVQASACAQPDRRQTARRNCWSNAGTESASCRSHRHHAVESVQCSS